MLEYWSLRKGGFETIVGLHRVTSSTTKVFVKNLIYVYLFSISFAKLYCKIRSVYYISLLYDYVMEVGITIIPIVIKSNH